MSKQAIACSLIVALSLIGGLSLDSFSLAANDNLSELPDSVAAELIGGAKCERFAVSLCNLILGTDQPKGCPFEGGFEPYDDPAAPYKGSAMGKLHTCGCVKKPGTDCADHKIYSKVTSCGSS